VYKKLKELHPRAPREVAESRRRSACVITEDLFFKVLSSILPRRAPDAAGWRGDYFKALSPGTKGDVFKLVEHILRNPQSLPAELRPFFFGARLTAIAKPDGGVRPIAVGVILRKLMGQALADITAPHLPDILRPHQFGVGIQGGAENVVQGLRLLRALNPTNAVVSIDFANAFNTIDRNAILSEVNSKCPLLENWFGMCYGKPSKLLVRGRHPIMSERGVQQGDPLGPLFFALGLQPALSKAAAEGCCVMAYLDDVYIYGAPSRVEQAVKVLLDEASKIGLKCNLDKCWSTRTVRVGEQRLPRTSHPSVLGAPLDLTEKLPTDIIPCVQMERIASLPDFQVALHLLRYMHNSRLTYSLRLSSEQASQELVAEMMSVTRRALATMLGRKDIPEAAWQQALLPQGPGLGLTNLPLMAPVMAQASILEAVTRLASLDRTTFEQFSTPAGWERIKDTPVYSLHRQAMEQFNRIEDGNLENAKLQHQFAVQVISPKSLNDFLSNPAIPDASKAVVKSTSYSPIASQFFHAIPTQKGLSLSSREMRIAICLLLGINLEMTSDVCPGCLKNKPLSMYHALSCKRYGGLILRHDMVKDVLADICRHARLSHEVEPPQAMSGNKLRPDILIRFGKDGHDIAYDLTIVNPLRDQGCIEATLKDEQSFLSRYERSKRSKYQDECSENGASFCPIVLSSFGGILANSWEAGIKHIIKKIQKSRFSSPNWAAPNRMTYWLQRIAIALWAGNVRKVAPFLKKEPLNMLF